MQDTSEVQSLAQCNFLRPILMEGRISGIFPGLGQAASLLHSSKPPYQQSIIYPAEISYPGRMS
jgi:hypothetical protein